MKSKIIFILFFAFAACNSIKDRKNLSVQGLYVTRYEGAYYKATDTIEITPLNSEAGTFHYTRRIGYRRISNGVLGKTEHKTEPSICVFNEQTAQLSEQRFGRIYSFSNDGNQLAIGNAVYKRIE
jgi:hypothetical protein